MADPCLMTPGRRVKGRRDDSERPCAWLEVAPGEFLRLKHTQAMQRLVRKGASANVCAAAGYLGDPVLAVVGSRCSYKLRLFTLPQIALQDCKRQRTR